MRYNRFFNAKFKALVVFSALCLFAQFAFADNGLCSPCGNSTVCSCQTYCEISSDFSQTKVQKGCGNNYYSNDKYLQHPEFEPNWTEAINGVGIAGKQYIKFKLEAGMSYRWTTYDAGEDVTGGVEYDKICTDDSDCGTFMKCYAKTGSGSNIKGRCMWPFDTELTLIDTKKSTKDCDTGTVVAFSRTGGNRNQSELEYKAPENMDVILLVTNNKYNTSNNTYESCHDSKIGESDTRTTILKWQRYVPSHCETCGDEDDYDFNKINNKVPYAAVKAPDWTPVSAYSYIDLPNYASANATEKWLKPGSYVDFNVEEGKIYRWSTCKSILFDTQLTLFKPDGDSGCGNFLAFDDDSETSYLPTNPYDQAGTNDYCPAGTKQSVLEWHANFTGKVRLLFNEYNCSQCARDNNSNLHWTHCFRVQDDYVIGGEDGVEKDSQGFPLAATDSTASSERVTLTYLYSFPLDWQRYDCNECRGTAVKKVYDFCGYGKQNGSCTSNVCESWSGSVPFCSVSGTGEVCGDTVSLQSGQYMTFALRRGSKYIFETPGRDDVVITVKAGESCNDSAVTLVQGVGQVAYFAETSAECFSNNRDPNNYSDLVTVLVSEPECDNADSNIKSINLKYSFYTDPLIKFEKAENAADSTKRFKKVEIPGDGDYTEYYEDTATGLRFIEADKVAGTWEEAVDICSKDIVLGGTTGALECPEPDCPPVASGASYTLVSNGTNTCAAQNDRCFAPKCNANYVPYFDEQVTVGSETYDICHPESTAGDDPLCGKCISSFVRTCTSYKDSNCCDKPTNKGACDSSNTCVSKGQLCANTVGVDWKCPSGYTQVSSSSGTCYDSNAGTSIYTDDQPIDPDNLHSKRYETVYAGSSNGTSCPSGMHTKTINGATVCEYDNCGKYTLKSNTACTVGRKGHLVDESKCYSSISLNSLGTQVPCCVNPDDDIIAVYDYASVTHTYTPGLCGSSNKVYGAAGEPMIPCASGWSYEASAGGSYGCYQCRKRNEDESIDNPVFYHYGTSNTLGCRENCSAVNEMSSGEQRCYYCSNNSTLVQISGEWTCAKCPSGQTLTHVNGEYKCKKTCASNEYSANNKCYPTTNKVYTCKEGWVEKDGYCKKIDTGKEYPICSTGNLVPVDSGHTCNPDKANTQDCMCKTNKCGIGTVSKVCPEKVCVVNEVPFVWTSPQCIGRELYTVVQGVDENDDIICSFTDLSSNDTCGKPSKGWTLPDINQLYSLVDFDLYNPATVFPFSIGTYNRVDLDKDCTADEQCFRDGGSYDGKYICVDRRCARNNWFWSSTTVLSKNENEGKFVWAVNMEDGRSYRVLKGCMSDDADPDKCSSYAELNLHATPYQVMCIKGSTFAALFHSGLPQTQQVFSGWACDKERSDNILDIYFEIVDKEGTNLATLVTSDLFVNIPGTTIKGIKYGKSDILPTNGSDDYYKIRANCNGVTDQPYLFKLDLNAPDGEVKTAIADLIKSFQGHGVPPYYVSAYAVDEGLRTASVIQPSKERFVLVNECGDTFKTYDGTYTENCEKSDFETKCGYTSPWSEDPAHQCQLCNQETCLWGAVRIPGCGDSILQSKYCVKSGSEETCGNTEGEACEVSTGTAVYAEGHESCEFYDFAANNMGLYTEQCDCGNAESGVYLLVDNGNGTYSCGTALAEAKCPDSEYYTGSGSPYCAICNQCSVYDTTYRKPYCGDSNVHSSEQCDDGNLSENDDCLNDCKEAYCGDGKVRSNPENDANKEMCDAGSANGTYAGGCSSDCKTAYTCGDKVIQNANCTSKCEACNNLSDDDPKKADCINTWCNNCVIVADAAEECDEGNYNGQPITYERFLNSLDDEWKSKCAAELNGVYYPISKLQTEFNNCLAKYKAFVEAHACSSSCTKSNVPACGDGKLQRESCSGYENCEEVPGANEVCDDGYDTTKSKYNGKGNKNGCALDCQFTYGCRNSTIDRPTCLPDMVSVACDSSTPASTIGLEYSGEIIAGTMEHISGNNVILFVNMATDDVEDCDAGAMNGQYGICNDSCTGKPYCGDGNPAPGNEVCDNGLADGGNKTIEDAWSVNQGGTCIGIYKPTEGDDAGRNICTDTPDKWAMYGVDCCQYGRYCGDGIIDNSLDGVGSIDDEGNVTDVNEWRSSGEKWDTDDSLLDIYTDDINLAVGFMTKQNCSGDACTYHDVELDIKIPIEEGKRYFLEYDVKVQKEGETPASMSAGAKMYDSDDDIIPTCDGEGCLDTNPLFFVDNGSTGLAVNTWINKKNTTPIVTSDGSSSSTSNWKAGTSYVKIYFQFRGPKWTTFLVRGLKVYTLESGKGLSGGAGAKEMCDNGEANLDIEAAKADTSYMQGCTKSVPAAGGLAGQTGCVWTNYCGDRRKHSVELCDNGDNKTNVYNGCEPGCTEIGPHCGDNMLDIRPDDLCPFVKRDEEACASYGFDEDCPYTVVDEEKCNRVSEKYNGNTYDNDGNFTGTVVAFVSEKCDTGAGNNNNFLGTKGQATSTIRESTLDINNYGSCRTDCTFSRCGDGILDYVVRADNDGNAKTKDDGNGNTVYDYVEECDCGIVDSADLLLPIPSGYASNEAYAVNQKTSEGVLICKDNLGNYYPNSNYPKYFDGANKSVFCRSNCTISRCGDGIKDKGEECDDGNNDDHDDCTNNCKLKSNCGDGVFSYRRSYLCEELMDLPLSSDDSSVPTMTTMRARGVVECCDSGDTACTNKGLPLCSKLVTDLKSSSEGNPYGSFISGKRALHYWFDKKVMHCCFNKKYETGDDSDTDGNCINPDHVFGSLKTLKDFAEYSCNEYQDSDTDPWEKCGNVSYSERCEFCDLANPKCACEKLGLTGTNLTECLNQCKKDPCGCVSFCEYKNSLKAATDPTYVNLTSCDGDKECIRRALKTCVDACEERNAYCDNTCWDRGGACGDGVVAGVGKNEACDNLEAASGSYTDFDGGDVPTSVDPNRGGKYCTGACLGSCTSESPMCGGTITANCWQEGCTVADHGSGSLSMCGDAKVDKFAGEVCDEGDNNGYYEHCNLTCDAMLAKCGDNTVQSGTDQRGQPYDEKCDDGTNNGKYKNDGTGYCDNDCQTWGKGGYCGDAVIQKANDADCTCDSEDANCKDPDGLECKPNVSGAAEDCDPQDARTLTLTGAGLALNDICSSCAKPDTCGDGERNPRFEGCDCGNSNGSETCSETYGLETVDFTCFSGCKADPIGKVTEISPVELSGWACDPDHPMEHPADLVRIEFYDKSGANIKTAYKKTEKDVSEDVVQACGGGETHGFFYNPDSEGTGVTDFETQNPLTVKIFVKSIDRAADDENPETEWVKLIEETFTMGKQCGDGILTKCEEVKITPKNISGTLHDGWVCHDEGHSCDLALDPAKCIEVEGTCAKFGLRDGTVCIDEKCDEGAANGPTNPCSSGKYTKPDGTEGTHSVLACDYNYCGDGQAQTGGNGKAFSDSIGYNEANYSSLSDSEKAFVEECDGSSSKACNAVFNTPCTTNESTPFVGCVPSGATVTTTPTDCDSGKCLWKRTDKCSLSHPCPSLSDEATRQGYGWSDSADFMSYVSSDSVVKYTRTWSGSAWTPAAPTGLKHQNTSGSTTAEKSCWFACYNENISSSSSLAKLVWNAGTQKCEPQNGYLTCGKCDDENGGRKNGSTWIPCTQEGWKTVAQTISIGANGVVSLNRKKVDAPAHEDHLPTGNDGSCSYTCKKDTTYAGNSCKEDKKTTACEGLGTGETWVTVADTGNGTYTVNSVTSRNITQTLNVSNGTYSPAATKVFASEGNIKSGSTIYTNKCFYTCAKNYEWNGSSCENKVACGNNRVDTPDCSDKSGQTNGTVSLTFGGKSKSVPCRYVPEDQREACDDGNNNGTYNYVNWEGVKVSACKSDCTGRIQNGSEFFCGDGKVQKKSGETSACGSGNNQSSNCVTVTGNDSGEYPGEGWSGTASSFTSEICDPEDSSTKNNVTKLCNMKLGLNRTDYYTPTTKPSCKSTCSGIDNAVKGTNCMWCGDEKIDGSENCEVVSNGIKYGNNSSEVFDYKSFSESVTSSNTSWNVPISGTYKITVYGAQGGAGDAGDHPGCRGAKVWGTFDLTRGDSLNILIGAKGKNGVRSGDYYYGGFGGGASAVKKSDGTLLLVAGGGGGGGYYGDKKVCSGGQADNYGSQSGGLHPDYSTPALKADGAPGDGGSKGGKGYNSGWSMTGGSYGARYTTNIWGETNHRYSFGGGGGGYTGGSAAWSDDYGGGGGGSYKSGTGSGWLSGDDASQTHTGAGEVVLELVKYAPCNSCKFATNTSDYMDVNKRKVACTNLAEHAHWLNGTGQITQTYGSSWTPSTDGGHGSDSTKCYFQCDTNYNWESGGDPAVHSGWHCVHEKSASCVGLPAANAVWSSNNSTTKTITLTYSGADGSGSWEPSTTGTYNTSTAANQCYYKCNDGYHNESGACVSSADRTHNCGTLPANAEWNTVGAYAQSWNGSAWTPAASTATYNTEASTTSCRFKCKSHYPWNGSQCKAETKTFTCTGLPTNAEWNSVGSYTQTWNGSTFAPAESSATYNTTASTTECRFKCKSGYNWINGQCIKTHYSWGFESNLPGDWVSQVSNSYWGRVSSGSYGLGSGLNSSSLPGPKEGSYAMCSTNTGEYHGTVANLILEVTIPSEFEKGTLSFSYTGTSEMNWDVFHAYLDPTQSDIDYNDRTCSNSATQIVCTYGSDHANWNPVSISNLSPGKHRILFKYRKDGSVSTSADRYCIDNLTLDYVSCSDSLKSAPLYLKLNEGSGSTTANSGTAGGSYSVSGGEWVSSVGGRGKAYKVSGSTTIAPTNYTKYSDNFTLMAWVRVASGYTITLPSQSSSGTNGTSGQHYLFGANHEGGNAGAGLSVGTNGIFVTAHGDSYMPPLAVYSGDIGTGWHHIAVVFNSRTPYIYLDGVLVKTGSASQRTTYSPVNIGSGSYGSFYGSFDDVRIIGSALSASEVMAEYGKLASCSGL